MLGLVGGAVLDIYSSGLTLLAAGLRVPRWSAALLDGVLMIVGTIYVVFFSSNFIGPFEGFLITLGVPIAAWCGVMLADIALRRTAYADADLFSAVAAGTAWCAGCRSRLMVLGSVVGFGLVVNTYASWLSWQGYLLGPFGLGGKTGTWEYANLGVIVALVVAFARLAGPRPRRGPPAGIHPGDGRHPGITRNLRPLRGGAEPAGDGPPLVGAVDDGGASPLSEDAGQAEQEGGDPGGALHPRGARWKQRRVLAVLEEPPPRPASSRRRARRGRPPWCAPPAAACRGRLAGAVLRGVEQDVPDPGGAAAAAVIIPETRAQPLRHTGGEDRVQAPLPQPGDAEPGDSRPRRRTPMPRTAVTFPLARGTRCR